MTYNQDWNPTNFDDVISNNKKFYDVICTDDSPYKNPTFDEFISYRNQTVVKHDMDIDNDGCDMFHLTLNRSSTKIMAKVSFYVWNIAKQKMHELSTTMMKIKIHMLHKSKRIKWQMTKYHKQTSNKRSKNHESNP